jgi:hypothetical protein
MMQVDAWSKSSLKSVLEGCSWQWALRKVYGIDDHGSPQTSMGTGYHKALEEWEKSGRNLSLKEMQTVAAETAFEQCKTLPMSQWFEHGTDPEQVIDFAKQAVDLWWNKPINSGAPLRDIILSRTCLGTEVYQTEKYEDFKVHGYIDAIYSDDRFITVVDHKTASSMRRWKYEQDATLEAGIYLAMAHAAQDRGDLPNLPIVFEYHVVAPKENKSRIVGVGHMTEELAKLTHAALVDADAIARYDAFRPKPDWNLCSPKYCSYFQGCRVDGTLTPYNLTPRLELPPAPVEDGVEP